MSLSLVAYDSSDEDSENEGTESASTIIANKADDDTVETSTLQTDSRLLLSSSKAISHGTNDKEETNSDTEDFKEHFFNALPKPKGFTSTENIEEDDDILFKKEVKHQAAKPAKRQTIRITVPSLSEFKDIEEEAEEKPTKIAQPQPSQTGCGLLAILVPPKKENTSNKILIPQAVKNAIAKGNVEQSSASRKLIKSQKDSSNMRKSTVDKSHNESDDEEDASTDFFGLTASRSTVDNSTAELLDSNIKEDLFVQPVEDDRLRDPSCSNLDVLTSDESNNSSKILTSNVINLPKEEILLKNKAEIGPKLPVPEQEYNIDTEGNVAFDEKAIEYLCGKRGVKRRNKEIDETSIIEITGEDIKPDEREWLVKALTEEPVQRPVSMQSCGISSQSKKKHQITYLAHQAKAMELELKNQWSQNRMARKQTKSKYGF